MTIETPYKTITLNVVDQDECCSIVRGYMEGKNMSLSRLALDMAISKAYLSDLLRTNRKWTPKRFEQAVKILIKK